MPECLDGYDTPRSPASITGGFCNPCSSYKQALMGECHPRQLPVAALLHSPVSLCSDQWHCTFPLMLFCAGHYEFVSLLPDDYTSAKGSLFILKPGTKAVVFDMDGEGARIARPSLSHCSFVAHISITFRWLISFMVPYCS